MKEAKPPFYVEKEFLGTTFDDFNLNPQKGILKHRREAVLVSRFSRNIPLNLPVASANMGTVTGPKMCMAMSLEGGIGILPRSNSISIEQQAKWVREVKRAKNLVIPNPFSVLDTQTVGETRAEMAKRKVHTLLVSDSKNGELSGMVTARRIGICQDDEDSISDWMKSRMNGLVFYKGKINSPEEARELLKRLDVEKLPVIDKNFKPIGLITSRDIEEWFRSPLANKDPQGRLRVGAAIGATGDYLERAAALIEAGADVLVMDIAHGHNEVMEEAAKKFKEKFNHELVCGNVATYEGALFLKELGVDGIKVGIGPGHGCWTRIETSFGVPQIHAIRAVYHALRGCDIPIIADGGVNFPADICKALAVGASSVMMGDFLAGTDETPGETIYPAGGRPFKFYRGMTSPEAKLESLDSADEIQNVEGGTKQVAYVGSVKKKLVRIKFGLQSMVSYAGEKSLQDAIGKISQDPLGYLIPLSLASQKESFQREVDH